MSIPLLDDAVTAAYPLVAGIATALEPIGGAAAAIVLCTIALRLLLLPLTMATVRGERARTALAPRYRELQRRHGKDPARLRTELAELYRDTGTSPLAGCLPALLQAPFLLAWYRILATPRLAGHPNALLAHPFLGAPLSTHLFGGGHVLVFVPFLLALVALAVVSVRRSRRVAAATGSPAPAGPLALLPFASVASALIMPLAAVLYLVTTLTWTAAESILLRRGLPAR